MPRYARKKTQQFNLSPCGILWASMARETCHNWRFFANSKHRRWQAVKELAVIEHWLPKSFHEVLCGLVALKHCKGIVHEELINLSGKVSAIDVIQNQGHSLRTAGWPGTLGLTNSQRPHGHGNQESYTPRHEEVHLGPLPAKGKGNGNRMRFTNLALELTPAGTASLQSRPSEKCCLANHRIMTSWQYRRHSNRFLPLMQYRCPLVSSQCIFQGATPKPVLPNVWTLTYCIYITRIYRISAKNSSLTATSSALLFCSLTHCLGLVLFKRPCWARACFFLVPVKGNGWNSMQSQAQVLWAKPTPDHFSGGQFGHGKCQSTSVRCWLAQEAWRTAARPKWFHGEHQKNTKKP